MPDVNPYAAPRADIEPVYIAEVIPEGLEPGVWRMGYLLVMMGNVTLPKRCVMTNGPVDTYDDTLIGYLTMKIPVPLSLEYIDSSALPRFIANLLMAVGTLTGIVGFGIVGIRETPDHLRPVGAAVLAIGAVVAGFGFWYRSTYLQSLYIEHISGPFLFVRGAHPDYLASLPELPYGRWRAKPA